MKVFNLHDWKNGAEFIESVKLRKELLKDEGEAYE